MTGVSIADYAGDGMAQRAERVMVSGNTRSTLFVPPSPPYAVRGEGSHIVDQLGHRVIDANNNYTSLIHGHARPEILAGVDEVLRSGTAFGLPTGTEVTLAELLAARTGHERWRFSNSGTEAVLTAVRAARAFTGRDLLVRFEGSYHGTADAVVSRNAPGITAGTRADVIEVPQGDAEAFREVMKVHGPKVAAVLIDLMPNRAGLVPADPGFVTLVREQTRLVDALLIVDEVISLRLASGGLAARYGAEPDLVSGGKIIGGGFPVGAVGGRAEVLAVFDPAVSGSVGWGGTFSANPISMTAGRIAMELFDESAVQRLNARGEQVRGALREAGVAVTGYGSLMRIREEVELDALWWAAYERGLLIGTNGLIALSTAMDDADLDDLVRFCVEAVSAARKA
jgi:glutamate-1-semialdehyde 2,1-aminomutase